MIWDSSCIFLLLFSTVRSLSFTVKISSKTAHIYRGQLLTLYTFIDGRESSLKFHLEHNLRDPGFLYLFPLEVQRPKHGSYGDECINFYRRSLTNVSLTHMSGSTDLGSFTGYFPAALVFANRFTCQDIVKNEVDDETLMRVTILNSHGEWLSGTLLGLREHFAGLLCLYGIAIAILLYLIRVSSCCTTQHASSLTSFSFGSQLEYTYGQGTRLLSEEQKPSALCPKSFCRPCSIDCGAVRYSERDCPRGAGTHFDGQTKRLQLLTLLIVMQFISISFARHELSRFANSTDVTYLNHPVSGADGPYSHIAELCSLISHYILLGLLIVVSLGTIHDSSIHVSYSDTLPGCGSGSPKCPVPAISTFKCLPFVSPQRLNFLLLITQIVWYLMREGLYWQNTYAPPEVWPFEEKHAFWAGWGLPNNNYLTSTPSSTEIPSRSSSLISSTFWIAWDLLTVYSPVSVLLLFARSILGLILATSLWHASRGSRTVRVRSMQYRFAMVGFAWFLSYPFVGICAFLLAEHIRYKLTVVGITLIQTGCLGLLLTFVSRQTLFWDISSLASSLPPLKCSPTPTR